ncbi:MAG: isopentenyl phosphate kinase [Candidatus Bathyarchaeia archaeon]
MILKLGGSVLTDRRKPFTLNEENVRRLSREIARGYDKEKMSLVVVHGAGSFGHPIVAKSGIHKGISRPDQLLAFAETQRWQNYLNVLITKSLQGEGLPAIPHQTSSHSLLRSGRIVRMPLDALKGFLRIGLVPVLYGVPAYDEIQGCSILSGDQIAPYIAKELGAERIIHGTNVDGIFTDDPVRNPDARLISEITSENIEEVKERLSTSSFIDVTGGMLGKVLELMDLAKMGITSQIINANKPGLLEGALAGKEGLGTTVRL